MKNSKRNKGKKCVRAHFHVKEISILLYLPRHPTQDGLKDKTE